MWPSGRISVQGKVEHERVNLSGTLLNNIPDGQAIRVLGYMHSRLHGRRKAGEKVARGPTTNRFTTLGFDVSPFSTQWIIWLHVKELTLLDRPDDILEFEEPEQSQVK